MNPKKTACCAGPLIALLVMVTALVMATTPTRQFRVELRKNEDRASVTTAKDTAVVTICSPSGIGRARLFRTAEKWPARLVIRLKLAGLESLAMENGKIQFNTSFNSPHAVPWWKMPANGRQAAEPDGTLQLTISREGDFFVFETPEIMLADNPREILLAWIDFFRN